MIKGMVSDMRGKQQIVHPCYKTYDTKWLREMTLRQMLAHIVGNASSDARMTFDNAELITVDVVEHIDEVSLSRGKRNYESGL